MRRFAFIEVPVPSDVQYRELILREAGSDARAAAVASSLLPLRKVKQLGPELSFRLFHAAHILGSGMAEFTLAGSAPKKLIFTGDIGENSAEVRQQICQGLECLGLEIDAKRNTAISAGQEGLISREGSRLAAYVIPTDEELLIARDTVRTVKGEPTKY